MSVIDCLSSFVVSAYIEHCGNESVAFINRSVQECSSYFRNFSCEFDGRMVTVGLFNELF